MSKYTVKITLEKNIFEVYNEIAICTNRPIEDILSDTLNKIVEIIARKTEDDAI